MVYFFQKKYLFCTLRIYRSSNKDKNGSMLLRWAHYLFERIPIMVNVTAQTLSPSLPDGDKMPGKASGSRRKRLISLDAFLERYVSREDPFKYE